MYTLEHLENIAALIFASSAVVTGIALLIISSCWKTLKQVISTLPADERKIIFKVKHIQDKGQRYKEELKGSLWLAILFLGLTILCDVVAMGLVARTMVGMHGGLLGETSLTYELQDFEVGRWVFLIGQSFLACAIFALAYYKVPEFLSIRKGRLDIIEGQSSAPPTGDQSPGQSSGKGQIGENPHP